MTIVRRSIHRPFMQSTLLALLLAPLGCAQQPANPTAAGTSGAAAAPTSEAAAAGPTAEVVLEPKAVDILKASGERLAAAGTLAFTALVIDENPSRLGPPLAYTTTSNVIVQRPNKLRVITSGDGPPSEFYYDGKTMVAYVSDGVFVQAWIGAEDKLPRMVRAVYLDDPLQLRHQLELSDWQLDRPVPAGVFASSKAFKANRIDFARPDHSLYPGREPADKGRPSKSE